MGNDWDLSNAQWGQAGKSVTDKSDEMQESKSSGKKRTHRRTTECYELSNQYLYRRAYGEDQLLQKLGKHKYKPSNRARSDNN